MSIFYHGSRLYLSPSIHESKRPRDLPAARPKQRTYNSVLNAEELCRGTKRRRIRRRRIAGNVREARTQIGGGLESTTRKRNLDLIGGYRRRQCDRSSSLSEQSLVKGGDLIKRHTR